MSSRANSRNASKTIRTVDDVDLPYDGKPNLRAILLPTSESAIYSTRLQVNDGVVCSVKKSIPLLSPCASSSEDEGSTALTSKDHTHTRRNRSQAAILLEQSADKERFTLGASLDNEVILKHPSPADEERCYINLVHAQLYPDPDRDSLILFNSSASNFNVQPLEIPQVEDRILPGQEARLECGNWQLHFGEGLNFEIKIIPWAAREVHRDWSLISPTPATSSLPAQRLGEVAAIAPTKDKAAIVPRTKDETAMIASTKDEAHQSPLLCNKTARPASTRKKVVQETAVVHYDPELPEFSSTPKISKTTHSQVFKAIRGGATVAIKVFRDRRGVKLAADRWRKEMEILSDLNHVSTSINFVV
jgi:hypothetical protein